MTSMVQCTFWVKRTLCGVLLGGCPHFRVLEQRGSTVYRGVLISGCWNRGVPLYTEVSSFQGVGIEEFHWRPHCVGMGWNRGVPLVSSFGGVGVWNRGVPLAMSLLEVRGYALISKEDLEGGQIN